MRGLVVVMTLTLLTACGPFYRTEYSYRPPVDPNGRLCIAQCGTTQQICRSNAQMQANYEQQSCEYQAASDYELCLRRTPNADQDKNCYRRSCQSFVNDYSCGVDYRGCYQSCGGLVESHQICTMNCPKS